MEGAEFEAQTPFRSTDLAEAHSAGAFELHRAFNRPTGLLDTTTVSLVVENAQGLTAIWLNDEPLGDFDHPPGNWRVNITTQVAPHNRLRMQFVATDSSPAQFEEVRIEIED